MPLTATLAPPSQAPVPIIAARIEAGLAHRTWAISAAPRDARCHVFLIRHGEAALTRAEGEEIELSAPAIL